MSGRPGSEAGALAGRLGQRRRLIAVLALTGAVMVVEVIGGLFAQSLALLSDAGHMLTDLLALLVSWLAAGLSSLPADARKTWGYHRLEILGALLNGALLVVISGVLLVKAAGRFAHPEPIAGRVVGGIALLGLLANLAAILILPRRDGGLNVRGARMHILGDALSSCGVLIAGVTIERTGWYRIDPIVAAIIAVVIGAAALRLVREAVDVLLEAAPAGLRLVEVSAAIAQVPGVREVHDLHVWSITTGLPALSGHVRVDGASGTTPDEMLDRIKRTLRDRFGIVHTTIQIESPGYQELGEVH